MFKLLSPATIREIEALADQNGISYAEMMQRAGRITAERAKSYLRTLPDREPARVTVLVGPGNNGGDGLVAGLILAQETSALVRFYLTSRRDETDPVFKPILDAGLFHVIAEDDQRYRVLYQNIASAHLILDALYGIGAQPPLRDEAVKLLRTIRSALREEAPHPPVSTPVAPQPAAPRPYILAVDCPSGLNCDTGDIDPNTLNADETVTFIAPKPGLLTFPGAAAVGTLTITSLGIPDDFKPLKAARDFVVGSSYVREHLPPRPVDSHKGTFGSALVLGGSAHYIGAPGLSAQSIYRTGAGLVAVGSIPRVISALAGHLLEPIWLPLEEADGAIAATSAEALRAEIGQYSTLLLGPGIGRAEGTRDLITDLLSPTLTPLVIDADALNLLADIPNWHASLPANTILTPHPGEMARLCQIDTKDVQSNRWSLAREKAAAWNCVIVVKGAHTVVAAPDGRLAVLPFKNSALATAGTGDVLAGIVTGLVTQGIKPFEAAVCGAYVHGLAGEYAVEQVGSGRAVIASDVLAALPRALAAVE
ncbi:MAG: NAD(P)H-hydrate dehydratase [Chloroflexota bacterium]|nr:NAD(P)H-hydrate dehydratase [Chloroflexota bacterium]